MICTIGCEKECGSVLWLIILFVTINTLLFVYIIWLRFLKPKYNKPTINANI